MKNDDIKQLLRECPDFKELTDEEINDLSTISSREVFSKGEGVFSLNHEGKKFYVVMEGRLTLRLRNNQSKEYRRGELFGEVAILGNTLRFGTIRSTEDSMLVSFSRDQLFYSDAISKELALKLTLSLTKKVISYFDDGSLLSSEKLIEKGECDYVEFKRSLNDHSKANVVRSMAGFMNLNGGTIFCGVDDQTGEIVGMDIDHKSFDELQKMMTAEIKRRIGLSFRQYIFYDVEQIDGKRILRIDCSSSRSPVFFRHFDKNGLEREFFVVRSGSENIEMKKTSEVISYVQERFRSV